MLSREKINAHEEFSPPRLGLITKNKVNIYVVDKPGRKQARLRRDDDNRS